MKNNPSTKINDALSNNFRKYGTLIERKRKRGLIVGLSGCGKTNIVISLIEDSNGLRIDKLYIYSTSLYQPKYEYLKALFKPLKEICFSTSENEENIISPQHIKPNSIIIFDYIVYCN